MESDLSRPGADPAAPATRSHYKWWVVFMLWFICCFNYADRQAIFAVFPKLKAEFGFNAEQLGWIASAFMWVYAGAAPLAGFVGDRWPRKPLILGGCVFWSCITVTTGWCGRLWHFVTVRALEGLGETFYFPASMSMLSDYHGPATRSRAMSLHQSSVYVGTILGSWIGAWFAERHGWRYGFYCFGAAGIVLALVLLVFLREPRRGLAETAAKPLPAEPAPWSARQTLSLLLRTPTALVLMAVFLGANFVATIFLTWTPTFLVEKFDFRLTTAGLGGTVFIHLASAASVPAGGGLADRLARRWAGGRMLVQAAGLGLGATFVVLVGMTRDVATLLGAMAAFGLCKGLYDANIFAALFDVVPLRARASAAGLMNTVGWGGGALGPVFVGWATQHGHYGSPMANMSHAIALGGVVYLIGAGLLVFAAVRLARGDAAPERAMRCED